MEVLFRYFLLPIMLCVLGLSMLNSSKPLPSHLALQQASGQVSTVDYSRYSKNSEAIHLQLDSHPTVFVISDQPNLKSMAERFDQARQQHDLIEISYSTISNGYLSADTGKFDYPWQIDIKTATAISHVLSLEQTVASEKQSRRLELWGGLIALLMGLGCLFAAIRKVIRGEPLGEE